MGKPSHIGDQKAPWDRVKEVLDAIENEMDDDDFVDFLDEAIGELELLRDEAGGGDGDSDDDDE
jgi:hypothetical protein